MNRQSSGFTLIELMIVVAAIGILATMALPTFHDRIIRTQVEEALSLAEIAKQAVNDYYVSHRDFPRDNQQAGIPQEEKLIGNYVQGIAIRDGAVHIRLGHKINAHVAGRMVTIRPAVVTGSPDSPISWLCGVDQPVAGMQGVGENLTSIPPRYLPMKCRDWGA